VSDLAVPVETELRLAIDPVAARKLPSHPALKALATGPARRARVVTTYHDTADRRLRRDGVALRVRREGRRWKLSIKGDALADATPGTVARPELEWKADGPTIDPVPCPSSPKMVSPAATCSPSGSHAAASIPVISPTFWKAWCVTKRTPS